MKRLLLAPLVLVAALLLVPVAAQAQSQALTLDQSQTSYDPTNLATVSGLLVRGGQTFTAGVSGSLTQVRLVLALDGSPTGNLRVAIYATSGGLPTGSALGTGSVRPASLTATLAWFSVTISSVSIRAGTQYAIVLSDPSDAPPIGYNVGFATTNPYAGGMLVASSDGGATWLQGTILDSFDLAFQTLVGSSQNSQGQNGNGQGQNHNGQGQNP